MAKGDDDAACKGQETVRSLRGVVGLQGQTDLHNAEAQQDKPMARISPKIKVDRLLITVMGSLAANAVTEVPRTSAAPIMAVQ